MQVVESANEIKDRATDWFDSATDYLEARWNLGVLDLSEKSANVVSSIATAFIIGTVGVIMLLFISLGTAWALGEYFDSPAKGYFAVAGIYALIGVILYIIKNSFIKISIINAIIKKFYYEK